MLFLYLLKKFYKNFIFLFLVLLFIFAISDVFIRVPFLASLEIAPKFLLLMLPLMAQFSIPLSSCLAIQFVVGNLYINDEVLFFSFFSSARKTLKNAVLFFSISLLFIYAPLVFWWAPQSYKNGKQFILNFAREQLSVLTPGEFHAPVSNFNFFFKSKNIKDNEIIYENLLLVIKEKDGKKYLINAKTGSLLKDTLFLNNGSIQNLGHSKSYFGNFEQTEISLDKLFESSKDKNNFTQLKFCTVNDLINLKDEDYNAEIELYKRISQILWQLLFPFLALWGIMVFAKRKSNLLLSVFLSGSIFLFSYISLNFAQVVYKNIIYTILLLYLPLMLISAVFYHFYHKKK